MDLMPRTRIVATAHPSSGSADRIWRIEIHTGQEVRERAIKDPFDNYQHDECRWYLNNYAQNDSLDVSRASKAEWLLSKYAKDLVGQLDLGW